QTDRPAAPPERRGSARPPRQRRIADIVPGPIAPRTGLPEPRDAADHQPARVRQQVRKSEPLQNTGPEALQQYVCALAQTPELRGTVGTLQIQDDGSLAAIQRREHPRRDLAQVI